MTTINDLFEESFLNWLYLKKYVPTERELFDLLRAIGECPEEFDITTDEVKEIFTERTGIEFEDVRYRYVGWVLGQI